LNPRGLLDSGLLFSRYEVVGGFMGHE